MKYSLEEARETNMQRLGSYMMCTTKDRRDRYPWTITLWYQFLQCKPITASYHSQPWILSQSSPIGPTHIPFNQSPRFIIHQYDSLLNISHPIHFINLPDLRFSLKNISHQHASSFDVNQSRHPIIRNHEPCLNHRILSWLSPIPSISFTYPIYDSTWHAALWW